MVIDLRFIQPTTMFFFVFFLKWLPFTKQFQAKPSKWFCVTKHQVCQFNATQESPQKKQCLGSDKNKCLDRQRACNLCFLTFFLFCCAYDVSARRQFPKESWLLIPQSSNTNTLGWQAIKPKCVYFTNPQSNIFLRKTSKQQPANRAKYHFEI